MLTKSMLGINANKHDLNGVVAAVLGPNVAFSWSKGGFASIPVWRPRIPTYVFFAPSLRSTHLSAGECNRRLWHTNQTKHCSTHQISLTNYCGRYSQRFSTVMACLWAVKYNITTVFVPTQAFDRHWCTVIVVNYHCMVTITLQTGPYNSNELKVAISCLLKALNMQTTHRVLIDGDDPNMLFFAQDTLLWMQWKDNHDINSTDPFIWYFERIIRIHSGDNCLSNNESSHKKLQSMHFLYPTDCSKMNK